MSFVDAVRDGFVRVIDFNGRSSRSAYWWFYLFYVLGYIAVVLVDRAIFSEPILTAIYQLGMLIPHLSLQVRRLHDINRSGWWILIALTGVGLLVLLFWFCCESDAEYNDFGSPTR